MLLASLRLSDARHVTSTAIADLWKVRQADGSPGALKIYKGPVGAEAPGHALVQAWQSDWVVPIRAIRDRAVLMDWAEGPSLGDQFRAGDQLGADKVLGEVARHLRHAPLVQQVDLPALETRLGALFDFRVSRNAPLAAPMDQARDLAHELLRSSPAPVPLHGDLHHDNVLVTANGPRVIDAKGLWGDPSYELANAFRNPRGAPDALRDPRLARHRVAIWAPMLGVPQSRLLQWAAVKTALSIAWRHPGGAADDSERDLLEMLLNLGNPA